ncbi:MAG: DUF2764 family protein [Parachlamydiales bacterium]|nr:DUF2764 family protein [Parachlamydiales bacterium]
MNKYYYLGSALCKVSLFSKPDISFEEYKNMLEINLSKSDFEKFTLFQRYIDITNLRLLWLNKEIDPRGNFSSNELEELILTKSVFPQFCLEFLEKYENIQDRLKNFSFLIASFFNMAINENTGFIKFYFKFERELRLILTAIRAKKYKKDFLKELQFEDFHDDFVAFILAQKDQETFEIPKEYEDLKNIFKQNEDDPEKLNTALLEYKFNKIENFLEEKPFTIDQILSFAALLIIAEDYNKLNIEEGFKIAENL